MDPSKDLKPCPTLGMTTSQWNRYRRAMLAGEAERLRRIYAERRPCCC